MEKLIELREQFEKILNPSIEFNLSINNYLFDSQWVTDIRESFFEKKQKEFLNYIRKEFDYNDKTHVKFIKIRFNGLIKSCELMQENNHESLSFFESNDWDSNLNSPDQSPNSSPTTLETPNPKNNFDDRNEYILEIIKGFYNLDDEIEKYFEEEELRERDKKEELKEELEEKEFYPRYFSQDILNYFLKEKLKLDEYEIEQSYAKAHLSYIISLHNQMVRNIGKDIEKRINIIEELESFDEDTTFGNSTALDNPSDLSLKFDLSKTNLGHLFYNLYEIGFIARDKSDIKDERSKLKNYLDGANLYYLDNKSYSKVQKMTRAMTVTRNTDSKIVNSEIAFLEILTSKLNNRINDLKLTLENLKKRGY